MILGLDNGDGHEKIKSNQIKHNLCSADGAEQMRGGHKSGFSLVELSIVLVVIGLLVATVTVGRDLIERATLNKVIKEIEQYKLAAKTFEAKYFYLPGDLPEATMYWGTAADCDVAQAAGTTLTCNGNGDGYLGHTHGDLNDHESAHFWRQLGNAGMINGTYSGRNNQSPTNADSPSGAIKGSNWTAWSPKTYTNSKEWQGRAVNRDANRLTLGIPANHSGSWRGASLSAANQYYIDRKIDDGLPYQGKVVDFSGAAASYTVNCASINSNEFSSTPPGTTSINAVYLVERDGPSGPNSAEGCLLIVDLE